MRRWAVTSGTGHCCPARVVVAFGPQGVEGPLSVEPDPGELPMHINVLQGSMLPGGRVLEGRTVSEVVGHPPAVL